VAKVKFEDALKELEEIVRQLEDGDLSLDESLAKYEAGIKAYRKCYDLLQGAEKKIQMLVKDEKGQLKAVPFEAPPAEPSDDKPVSPSNQ